MENASQPPLCRETADCIERNGGDADPLRFCFGSRRRGYVISKERHDPARNECDRMLTNPFMLILTNSIGFPLKSH